MFGASFFGASYFAPHYFGEVGGSAPPPPDAPLAHLDVHGAMSFEEFNELASRPS